MVTDVVIERFICHHKTNICHHKSKICTPRQKKHPNHSF